MTQSMSFFLSLAFFFLSYIRRIDSDGSIYSATTDVWTSMGQRGASAKGSGRALLTLVIRAALSSIEGRNRNGSAEV